MPSLGPGCPSGATRVATGGQGRKLHREDWQSPRRSRVKFAHADAVAIFVLVLTGCDPASTPTAKSGRIDRDAAHARNSLRRTCRFLWSRQGEDGRWHNQTYDLLHSGQALTPFILYTLLKVPPDAGPRSAAAVNRAIGFIRRHINDEGVNDVADPDLLKYPN